LVWFLGCLGRVDIRVGTFGGDGINGRRRWTFGLKEEHF
jgi:hypothetical protein